MIAVGNHIYDSCCRCGKIIRITGLFGGWHFCVCPCDCDMILWAGKLFSQNGYCSKCGEAWEYKPNFFQKLFGKWVA